MNKCRVCEMELDHKYGVCTYCGYDNHPILTLDAEDFDGYREAILKDLTDFRITTYGYKYDSDKNELGAPKKTSYSIAKTGTECFEKLTWTQGNNWIAHPQEDVSEGEVEITYRYKNQPKKLTSLIKLKALEGVWYIGLKIERNLHISVFVGVDEEKLAGEAHDLALELR